MNQIKPEEATELILWDWLKTKSSYVKEVYFNRQNLLNAPIFTTKGINKKPDFIIKIDRGYGVEYAVVEIKNAAKARNIHDAGKIIEYYKRYIFEKTKYSIDGTPIQIKYFLVATENSVNGYLFKNEKEVIDNLELNDEWRKANQFYELEPSKEYSLTSLWVRRLWADFRYIRKEIPEELEKPSVGILMCEFSKEDFSPRIMIMNYNSHLTKAKWGARWWKI